ncbi:MAG: hypothetical protein HQK50_08940 [Oligoflexia bacterium]|nr:hypothetical protein [Oligoflexia bacterium]MBF0365684.1 hypothetical protein [Oligoflexia bacterium]
MFKNISLFSLSLLMFLPTWVESDAEDTPVNSITTPKWFYRDAPPKKSVRTKYSDFVFNGNEINVSLAFSNRSVPSTFYGAVVGLNETFPKTELLRQLPLSLVKIGGSDYSRFNWIDGILNPTIPATEETIANPPRYFEKHLNVVEKVKIARSMGADVILQVNLLGYKPTVNPGGGGYTLSTVDTAKDAYALVKYLNGEKKLNIKYFVMDNEPLIWSGTHWDLYPKPISANLFLERFIKTVVAMRQAQKEISGNAYDIKIIGPEESQTWSWFQTFSEEDCVSTNSATGEVKCYYNNSDQFENFLEYFLYILGKVEQGELAELNPQKFRLIDYFSIHAYPLFRSSYQDPDSFITTPQGAQDIEGYLNAIALWNSDEANLYDQVFPRRSINFFNWLNGKIQQHYPGLKLAVTEFGIDSGALIDYHPLLRPLYNAEFMAIAIANNVDIFNISYLNASSFNPNSWALISEGHKTIPTFHSMSLMVRFYQGKLLQVSTKYNSRDVNAKKLTAYATYSNDGFINLLTFNRSNEAVCADLNFVKENQNREILGKCFPPLTMTILRIPIKKEAKNIDCYQYGQQELQVRSL